jgi:hypothetical protein
MLTLFFSLVSYIPLELCRRGIIAADDDTWWKIQTIKADEREGLNRDRKRSLSLILYVYKASIMILC